MDFRTRAIHLYNISFVFRKGEEEDGLRRSTVRIFLGSRHEYLPCLASNVKGATQLAHLILVLSDIQ
jgi:hypothetical protein